MSDAHDQIIQGLLARLPKPGDVWPAAARRIWLDVLEASFDLIYKDGTTVQSAKGDGADAQKEPNLHAPIRELEPAGEVP